MCDDPEDPGYNIDGNVLIVIQIRDYSTSGTFLSRRKVATQTQKANGRSMDKCAGKSESGPSIQFRVAMTRR